MQILRAMSAEAKLGVLALLTALALVSPSMTGHTSQTIVNPYKGRVVIHNDTGVAIRYMFKWGPSGEWKTITVNNGMLYWHSYKLDADDRAPAPYIRFHNAAGAYTEYKLKFGKFGSGPRGEIDSSTHYEFAFAGGSRLDLYTK
jgi:hypothetical protein